MRGEGASKFPPLALNDPTGIWQIRVRKVLTGASAATRFTVNP